MREEWWVSFRVRRSEGKDYREDVKRGLVDDVAEHMLFYIGLVIRVQHAMKGNMICNQRRFR